MDNLIFNAGNIIKSQRKSKGFSTLELANLLHVSPGLINNIENCKTDCFNLELLYSMSKVLEIPVTDIISYDIDNIFDDINSSTEISSSIRGQVLLLIKALVNISNNKNWNAKKMALLIEKLNNDINFSNKISSI